MTSCDATKSMLRASPTHSILGPYISKIYRPQKQLKHLSQSVSIDYMQKTIDSYIRKQRCTTKRQRTVYMKSKINSLHKNLKKYTRHDISVGDLIKFPKNNNKNNSIDIINEQNQIKYRQVMLQRKYNVPMAIKISVLQQIEAIKNNKQKITAEKNTNCFMKQPLINNMKKILKKHKNQSYKNNKDCDASKYKITKQNSMYSFRVPQNCLNIDQQNQNKQILYQRISKNHTQHSKTNPYLLPQNQNGDKIVMYTYPLSQKTLRRRANKKIDMILKNSQSRQYIQQNNNKDKNFDKIRQFL